MRAAKLVRRRLGPAFGWAAAAILAAAGPVLRPADPPVGVPADRIRLVMFGDSVTRSASAAAGSGVTDFTRRALDRESAGRAVWIVVNQGRGRETAGRAGRRIRGVLERERPDWVSLAYGLVDAARMDPDRFERHVRRLLEAVAEAAPRVRVALIAAPPLDESRHEYGRREGVRRRGGANRFIRSEINERLRRIAFEKGLPFIDLGRHLAARPEWGAAIRGDGIHPDAKGNRLIGEFVGRALAACHAARVAGEARAAAREERARGWIGDAVRLFAASGPPALPRCAALEERAWIECPYLPEAGTTFASLAAREARSAARVSARIPENSSAPPALR